MPAQAPLQPVKIDPGSGVAVSVTMLEAAKFALHVVGHVIPPGALVTLPVPPPRIMTLTFNPVGGAENS